MVSLLINSFSINNIYFAEFCSFSIVMDLKLASGEVRVRLHKLACQNLKLS